MDIIEDLYFGNINPHERNVVNKERYDIALKKTVEAREKLTATLNEEQKKLLDNYADKDGLLATELEYSAFLYGFKIATCLLCEAIFGCEHE